MTGNTAFGAGNAAQPNLASQSTFTFGPNKPSSNEKPSLFGAPTTQSSGFGSFSTPTFGPVNPTTSTTTSSTNLFGSSASAQSTPIFGTGIISSTPAQPKPENKFGMAANQSNNTPTIFGAQNKGDSFGKSMNPPAYSANTGIFGSASNTQSPPSFDSSNNLFSTPTTMANQSQPSNNTFGSTAPAIFAFGQPPSQTPATTTSTGIFGSSNTGVTSNTPFAFGQGNTNQPSGMFETKPVDNSNTNSSLTAPPAFGSTSPAFNFTPKPMFGSQPETKPPSFSFNGSNNTAVSVPAFGSAPTAPQFGSNGIGKLEPLYFITCNQIVTIEIISLKQEAHFRSTPQTIKQTHKNHLILEDPHQPL